MVWEAVIEHSHSLPQSDIPSTRLGRIVIQSCCSFPESDELPANINAALNELSSLAPGRRLLIVGSVCVPINPRFT